VTQKLGQDNGPSFDASDDPISERAETPSLRRVVTLPWLILYGLGSTVGAGIYVLTGAVAGRAGMQAPLAFLLAALLALFTALSFAELSARFPRAGGALVYVREAIGWRWLSVLVGLLTATAGVISAATVSRGFVQYLGELWTLPTAVVLIGMVGGLGLLAAWGVQESVVAAGLFTIVEVLGLVAILVFGVVFLSGQPVQPSEILSLDMGAVSLMAIGSSAVLCFYAFLGFEDIVNVAEEVRDVRSALPRAILWTLGLSTLLYVGVVAVAVLIVPPTELASAQAPLALVFERSGGNAEVLALIALAAMVNGALVQIVMASRILYSLSREGPLPNWLGWIHPRTRTPVIATLAISLGVGLFAMAFPLASLAAATASVALAVFSLVNLSLLVLLINETRKTNRTDGNIPIWVPAIGGITSIGFLALEMTGKLVTVAKTH
jgi:basic amino acid/polyamine antiporter, APA family